MQDGVLSGEGEDPAPTRLVKQRRAGPQLSHQNARLASLIAAQLAHVLLASGRRRAAQLCVCTVGTRMWSLSDSCALQVYRKTVSMAPCAGTGGPCCVPNVCVAVCTL